MHRPYWLLIPAVCIAVFAILYIIATIIFPGGSTVDVQASSFSWVNNYWCDLLDTTNKRGEPNTARPIGITAMLILCPALALLWYAFPMVMRSDDIIKQLIRYTGIGSMLVTILVFTPLHSKVIAIAGISGAIALTATLMELYRTEHIALLITGVVCIVLLGTNMFIYFTRIGVFILPLLQKFTFLITLCWFAAIDLMLYRNAVRKKSFSAY